jgi:Icc-related predicted phosphoesterase
MKIDCISDLHGSFPHLEGGDLLIVAGDLTACDEESEYAQFICWIAKQKYKKIIVIGGNHDNYLQKNPDTFDLELTCCIADYLLDSGTKFDDLKIWGSPWTKSFEGMNPACKAFTLDTEEELKEKWDLIPYDTDLLITHSPPYGILDRIEDGDKMVRLGSYSLYEALDTLRSVRLHVFGHIHEGHGLEHSSRLAAGGDGTIFVNASQVNRAYSPVNKPIRVFLPPIPPPNCS